jgi:probable rRNA maturation factor
MKTQHNVEVSNVQSCLPVETGELCALAHRILELQRVRRARISIAVVDNPTIHELNRRHLGHDWPTDVITFPLPDDAETIAGEIVVSGEMAACTAEAASVDRHAELTLYIVHGLLHLTGHDDQTAEDAVRMRERENEILQELGIENTYAKALALVDSTTDPGNGENSTCPA